MMSDGSKFSYTLIILIAVIGVLGLTFGLTGSYVFWAYEPRNWIYMGGIKDLCKGILPFCAIAAALKYNRVALLPIPILLIWWSVAETRPLGDIQIFDANMQTTTKFYAVMYLSTSLEIISSILYGFSLLCLALFFVVKSPRYARKSAAA